MDSRCIKFWDDAYKLITDANTVVNSETQFLTPIVLKELRTMSRFLQKNQSQRFSEAAQQKLIDAIGLYHTLSKQPLWLQIIGEATFQVIKDGLAMPFNVIGTKQKKRLMKWYNECSGKEMTEGMEDESGIPSDAITWTVLGIDEEGYLSLLNEETGSVSETFCVPKKSNEYKRIQLCINTNDVQVVTVGDRVLTVTNT